jgi:hypothetical protein
MGIFLGVRGEKKEVCPDESQVDGLVRKRQDRADAIIVLPTGEHQR